MAKLYPDGFKKKKSKVRAPVPPPGFAHESKEDYKRSRSKEIERDMLEEALEELDEEESK